MQHRGGGHSVNHQYAFTLLNPKEGLSGVPKSPAVRTRRISQKATGVFKYTPTWSASGVSNAFLTKMGAPSTATPRAADIVICVVNDQVFDQGPVVHFYVPSVYLEAIIYNRSQGGTPAFAPFDSSGNIQYSVGANQMMGNPTGFGIWQKGFGDPISIGNAAPWGNLNIADVPVGATIEVCINNAGIDHTYSSKVNLWDKTSFAFVGGVPGANNVQSLVPFPPQRGPDGQLIPYQFIDVMSSLPTIERYHTVQEADVGKPVPNAWTSSGGGFSNRWLAGDVFTNMDIGYNPFIQWTALEAVKDATGGTSGIVLPAVGHFANQLNTAWKGFFGNVALNNAFQTTEWYSDLVGTPMVRGVAQRLNLWNSDVSQTTMGEATMCVLPENADTRFLTPNQIYSSSYSWRRDYKSLTDRNPASVMFVPEAEDASKFFPMTDFGNGASGWGTIMLTGITGGELTYSSLSATPLAHFLKFECFGVCEVVDEVSGDVTPSSILFDGITEVLGRRPFISKDTDPASIVKLASDSISGKVDAEAVSDAVARTGKIIYC